MFSFYLHTYIYICIYIVSTYNNIHWSIDSISDFISPQNRILYFASFVCILNFFLFQFFQQSFFREFNFSLRKCVIWHFCYKYFMVIGFKIFYVSHRYDFILATTIISKSYILRYEKITRTGRNNEHYVIRFD